MIWEISKGARVDKVKDRMLSSVICLWISYIFHWKEQKDFFCDRSDVRIPLNIRQCFTNKGVVTFYIQVEIVVSFYIQENIKAK